MDSHPLFPFPSALPPPVPRVIGHGLTYLDPQSRAGVGPGIVVIVDDTASGARIEKGVPSPLMKWAEESYCVVEVLMSALECDADESLAAATQTLDATSQCTSHGRHGLVSYSAQALQLICSRPSTAQNFAGMIFYVATIEDGTGQDSLYNDTNQIDTPLLLRIPGRLAPRGAIANKRIKAYRYLDQALPSFATPFQDTFNYAAEAISHTRNLSFLKPPMNGPYFDLETLWDEHTYWEFEYRSVEHTMNTMVQEPYVNHIPTITGGIGRKELTDFYRDHFIFSNPHDTQLELISRTVGVDRVVDEMIFKFTHDRIIDWILPGVPPTQKYVEVALIAIVNFRGDRLYHEHITWDSASVLHQIGLLSDAARLVQPGSQDTIQREVRIPVAGPEAVAKMRDKTSVSSNGMIVDGQADHLVG